MNIFLKKIIVILVFLLGVFLLLCILWFALIFLAKNVGGDHIKGYNFILLLCGLFLIFFVLKFGLSLLGLLFTVPFKILFLNTRINIDKVLKAKLEGLNTQNIFAVIKYIYFVYKIIRNPKFDVKNEELIFWKTSKNYYSKIQRLNSLLNNKIGKKQYITDFTANKESFQIEINKGNETNKELTSKLLQHKDEILSYFETSDFIPNIDFSRSSDNFFIHINNVKSLWKTKTLDLQTLKLKKGELLAGFYPQIQKGISYKDYLLKTFEITHNLVAAATRSGKDVFMRNIFVSCLYQIKYFSNIELHFFDTKGNDGVFLDNLKSYGIHRYTQFENYAEILKKLVDDMRNKQEKIGVFSNIYEYNEKSGKQKLKENFIVINEFLSLTKRITDRKELDRLLGYLVSLTSEGAGAGIKCIFMSQTARKDTNSKIAEILVNIKTKFALKVNNFEESFILSRGLSESEKVRVNTIVKYNCIHIEDNAIQREFKAYYFSQQDLIEWIGKNFEKEKEFGNKNINDYLKYSQENNEISFKTASEVFELSRADWNKFIKYVEEKNLIERLPNNKIIWKKSMKHSVDII